MPWTLLFRENLASSLRSRGLALVLLAALVPPALTAAWVFSHQADVTAADVSFEPAALTLEAPVNVTATVANEFDEPAGPFNVTVRIGYFEVVGAAAEPTFREIRAETFRSDGLAPGERESFTLRNWTAQAGTFIFQVLADSDDELKEIEERNNDRFVQAVVRVPQFERQALLVPAGNATAGAPQADLNVTVLSWEPSEVYQNQQANVTVRVRNDGPGAVNATVRLQAYRATVLGYSATPSPNLSRTVAIGPGNETEVTFQWRPTLVAQYAVVASAEAGPVGHDADTADNSRAEVTFVDRRFVYEPPEPKATAKDYYRDILGVLHLKLLIPLVALFYAAGTLEDERARGNLPYLLTRPVPRWHLVTARLAANLVAAAGALLVGIVATYILLLGLPQGTAGYLYWPLVFTLAVLVAYAALFTLVAVASDRPYLVGLAYVLGLELLIFLGRSVDVNGRPLLQDWVAMLSLSHWTGKALEGWDPNAAFRWWPAGADAGAALLVLAAVAVAGLAGAAWWVRRREFPE